MIYLSKFLLFDDFEKQQSILYDFIRFSKSSFIRQVVDAKRAISSTWEHNGKTPEKKYI